ncbi:MAG: DinB family protein [Terriglobales bacterium]
MSTDFATIASMFNTNAQAFEKATEGVPAEKWLVRPGNDSNHLAWITGHVVVHRAIVAKILGFEWSAPWEKLFARGAQLVAPEQYPDAGEIRRSFQEVSEKVASVLPGMSAEILRKPVPKEQPSLDGTVGGSIALLCLHETFHVGQMTYLRKWLGYGPAFG